MKIKYFKTKEAADEFAKQFNEDVYCYNGDSKHEYICCMEAAEGYTDKNIAETYPYVVCYKNS